MSRHSVGHDFECLDPVPDGKFPHFTSQGQEDLPAF